MKRFLGLIVFLCNFTTFAQNNWQQHIDYQMDIQMDVKNNQYTGIQKATYYNNSPDTLKVLFYHLYLNAFQPDSQMNALLKTIPDPDSRMVINTGTKENPTYQSKIDNFTEKQIGYIKVKSLLQNGKELKTNEIGTILKVFLNEPILPHSSAVFEMKYNAQIPPMVRRLGTNSPDGVALSMSQWYPKIAQYDTKGWHPSQYLIREFYGVWANFDVKITIDKNYIIAGTGILQNPQEIGFGYNGIKEVKTKAKNRTWHFKAENVIDFTWAADPDYKHDIVTAKDGKLLHFFYKKYDESWKKIQPEMVKVFNFYNEKIGKYPWDSYSFIQGGDGGMEYAMCTLIKGGDKYDSFLGTAIHELGHTWFQHIFAINEQAYPWFDEGFTNYIENWAMSEVIEKDNKDNFCEIEYAQYIALANKERQEVPTTRADFYASNLAYSITSYCKGAVFASQLKYIIGKDKFEKTLKEFYKNFALKHPTPDDFIRCAEKVSGLELKWILNEFMQTTHTVDYAIEKVEPKGNQTQVTIKRIGRTPMPLDLVVIPQTVKLFCFYIPSDLMFGEKENPFKKIERFSLKPWGWAYPTYTFTIDLPISDIKSISIDPQGFTADVNYQNNYYPEYNAK
jgi:peptidase M1, membrane alanine aminopeptidase